MRYIPFIILLAIFAACEKSQAPQIEPKQDSWPFPTDSMSLAILLVEDETYEFQGGHLSHHAPCDGCDGSNLPFKVELTRWGGDYWILVITYLATSDTLFLADIVWSGRGRIFVPEVFVDPSMFEESGSSVPLPKDVEYLLQTTPSKGYLDRASRAWETVARLEIVRSFARRSSRTGILRYTPSTGGWGLSNPKWVIFLCAKATKGSA